MKNQNEKPESEEVVFRKLLNLADALDDENKKKKIPSSARIDLLKIIKKYKDLQRNCTNPQEYKAIGVMATIEIHKFFGFTGPLVIDGKVIIEGEEDIIKQNKVSKLN